MPRIGISSTMLRERVRAGGPIRYYVPDPVVSYIERHRLYAGVGSVR
jgi:nicotinate-nucleotide adenylyltransferase